MTIMAVLVPPRGGAPSGASGPSRLCGPGARAACAGGCRVAGSPKRAIRWALGACANRDKCAATRAAEAGRGESMAVGIAIATASLRASCAVQRPSCLGSPRPSSELTIVVARCIPLSSMQAGVRAAIMCNVETEECTVAPCESAVCSQVGRRLFVFLLSAVLLFEAREHGE